MPPRKTRGRIYFVGNPWPDGHAVTRCVWTARLEPETGIWFDLHLESEDYYAADDEAEDEEGDEEEKEVDVSKGDWESKIVWNNYHSCILSSTQLNGEGFLVGTKASPLDMHGISGKTFVVDGPPIDFENPRAFGVYLLGHDVVSDHRITFAREPNRATYSIDWRGKIALYYAGEEDFKYEFHATLTGIRFKGIRLPEGTKEPDIAALIRPFISNLAAWNVEPRGKHFRLVPSSVSSGSPSDARLAEIACLPSDAPAKLRGRLVLIGGCAVAVVLFVFLAKVAGWF